jgi:endonuclease/exonuclease/phosphatase family metal-dependent hydrolase
MLFSVSTLSCPIELKTNIPILCISTYLPTKVENDRYEEYSECIDQIFEIIQMYQNSHEIVIGGDFNEDISKNNNSRRVSKLKELIADCELQINFHGPTFINAKGVEVSEIDYFLYKTTAQVLTEKIDDTHVSDHHPIKLKLIRTLKFYGYFNVIVPNIQFKFVFSILSLVRALFGRIIKYFHSFFYSLS